MNFKSYILASIPLFLMSCSTTTIYRNQAIPAAVSFNREKDTLVLLNFRNDDYRIANTLEDKLKEKGFKTMATDTYYQYKNTLEKETHFVTLQGNVKGHVSKPVVSEVLLEECGRDPWGNQIHRINFSEDIKAEINVNLTIIGATAEPYNSDLSGIGYDRVGWTQCGRTPPPNFYPPRADSKPAIKEARNIIVSDFEKLIDGYYETVPVTLFTADQKIIPAMNAGNNQFAYGNLQEAVKYYKEAITQAKSNPNAKPKDLANCYYNLGITQGYLGDEEGFKNIDKAYSLNPDSTYLYNRNLMQSYFDINKNYNR